MNYQKHTKRVLWVGIANVFLYARNIFLLPILTRSLGTASYGLWVQLYAITELLIPLGLLRLPSAATRFLSAEQDLDTIRVGYWTSFLSALISSIILSIALMLLAFPIRNIFGSDMEQITDFFWAIAFLLILGSAANSCINYYRTFEKSSEFCKLILFESMGFVLLTMIFSWLEFKIMSPIMGMIVVKIMICLMGLPKIVQDIGFSGIHRPTLQTYLSYCLPLVPQAALYWTIQMSDRYFIDFYLNKEEVGRYAATYFLGGIISFIYAPVFTFLTPSATKLWESNSKEELKQFLYRNMKYPALLAIPIVITSPFWALSTLELLAGSQFVTSIPLMLSVLFGYTALMVGTFFVLILHLRKDNRSILWTNILAAAANVLLNILFIPHWGILGAGFSTAITFSFQTLIFYLLARQHFSFYLGIFDTIKISIISLTALSITFVVPASSPFAIFVTTILVIVIYLTLIWIMKVVNKSEILFFYSLVRSKFW